MKPIITIAGPLVISYTLMTTSQSDAFILSSNSSCGITKNIDRLLPYLDSDVMEKEIAYRNSSNKIEHLQRRRDVMISLLSAITIVPLTWSLPSASAATIDEPKECQNGRIVSESAVPGAYQQTCMNLDERTFPLQSIENGNSITVYQGTNAGAGEVAGRTGVAVWNSGVLLTRLLDKLNQSTNQSIYKNKSIIELGCGAALSSIAVAKLGASSVLATDANEEVLNLAQRNIERNDMINVIQTAKLQWGIMDATEVADSADIIIGSDLTYNSGSWVALAETMATIIKPDGIIIYLTLGHSGFNVGGELGGFLSVAENTGLRVLTRETTEWKDNLGTVVQSMDELLAGTITQEERNVIDANGGVRVVVMGRKKYSRKG